MTKAVLLLPDDSTLPDPSSHDGISWDLRNVLCNAAPMFLPWYGELDGRLSYNNPRSGAPLNAKAWALLGQPVYGPALLVDAAGRDLPAGFLATVTQSLVGWVDDEMLRTMRRVLRNEREMQKANEAEAAGGATSEAAGDEAENEEVAT